MEGSAQEVPCFRTDVCLPRVCDWGYERERRNTLWAEVMTRVIGLINFMTRPDQAPSCCNHIQTSYRCYLLQTVISARVAVQCAWSTRSSLVQWRRTETQQLLTTGLQDTFSLPEFFYPENGGNMFIRNVGSHENYKAEHPRKRYSSTVFILFILFSN
jgi:hypothetical protein